MTGSPVVIAADVGNSSVSLAAQINGSIQSCSVTLDQPSGWPERGDALLWLETGVKELLPVILSPEELETLRELGYTR